jgi:hypothetical protein
VKRTLVIEFDNEPGALSYQLTGEEQLTVTTDGQAATVYVNSAGGKALAQILAKLALSDYEPGFHIHLKANFGEEATPDVLTLVRE